VLDAITDSSSTLKSGSDARPKVQESPTASTSLETNLLVAASASHVPVAASTGLASPLYTFCTVSPGWSVLQGLDS